MSKVNDHAPPRSDAAERWLEENLREQEARYHRIARAMDDLSAERDQWIRAFFQRIQTRGFNFDGDQKRKIPKDHLPEKPDRPFKVVF